MSNKIRMSSELTRYGRLRTSCPRFTTGAAIATEAKAARRRNFMMKMTKWDGLENKTG
jgi:hypothetical protein